MAERRLLAGYAAASLSEEGREPLALKLVEKDELAAVGSTEEMVSQVTSVYDAATKAFEKQSG